MQIHIKIITFEKLIKRDMKIALYLRVSTDIQDYNRQLNDLTELVNREGNEVFAVFKDKVSGLKSETKRADLKRLLKLTYKDIQAVYVTELSRLSRNPTYLKILIEHFRDMNINVYFYTQNINTINPDGKPDFISPMMISILSEYSAYENVIKNQRIHSGKHDSITKKGNSYTYKPSLGYSNIEKKLVINSDEAETIKMIYNKYGAGESIIEVVRFLNMSSIKTRNADFIKKDLFKLNSKVIMSKNEIKWTRSAVISILKNTVYCGYKILKDGERIVTPAIISEEQFNFIQKEISNRLSKADRSVKHEYLLRGLLICGDCGNYYVGGTAHKDLNYKCSDRTHVDSNSYTGCKNSTIDKLKVEGLIWNVIKSSYQLLRSNQILEGNITAINQKIEDFNNSILLIEGRQTELIKESDKIIYLFRKDLLNEKEFEKQNTITKIEQNELTKKIKVIKELRAEESRKLKSIHELDTKPFDLIEVEKSYTLKKEAVKELLKEVLIHKIDNKFTVFQLNFKAGYTLNLVRETRKDRYHIINNIYVFNKETKIFQCSSFDYTAENLFNGYLKTPELMDLFIGFPANIEIN